MISVERPLATYQRHTCFTDAMTEIAWDVSRTASFPHHHASRGDRCGTQTDLLEQSSRPSETGALRTDRSSPRWRVVSLQVSGIRTDNWALEAQVRGHRNSDAFTVLRALSAARSAWRWRLRAVQGAGHLSGRDSLAERAAAACSGRAKIADSNKRLPTGSAAEPRFRFCCGGNGRL
jgi:hypothetical protein